MPATLDTTPPNVALSGSGIYVGMSTDLISSDISTIELVITSTGPADTETLEIEWPDGSVIFTADAAADGTPELWPLKDTGETLVGYMDRIADFLTDGGLLAANFTVVRTATGIELRAVQSGTYVVAVPTNTMANVATTVTLAATDPAPINLKPVLQVLDPDFEGSGLTKVLHTQHASYEVPGGSVVFDISAAFAHLAPALPDPTSIKVAGDPVPLAWYCEEATAAHQRYILRYGERYGTPAIVGSLTRTTAEYHALYGAKAGSRLADTLPTVCHNYVRRDGDTFRKPIRQDQPDWFYFFTALWIDPFDATLVVRCYWSDGSSTDYTPFTAPQLPELEPLKLYMMSSGYYQLKLHLAPAPDPDVFMVGYDVRMGPLDDTFSPLATIRYDLSDLCHEQGLFLLFSNGMGGCETVWLNGKAQEKYGATSQEFQRPRWYQARPSETGDFDRLDEAGRRSWECSTGWHTDTFYIEHLRQLPLSKAWLIDMENKRFMSVLVDPTDSPVMTDDETLHEATFRIRAGWYDGAFNH